MNYFRFYFALGKLPIRAIREDRAFVNDEVPNIFGFWVKDSESRKPSRELWDGVRPRPFPVHPYPRIDKTKWYTYRKLENGKVRRVTLAEYERRQAG